MVIKSKNIKLICLIIMLVIFSVVLILLFNLKRQDSLEQLDYSQKIAIQKKENGWYYYIAGNAIVGDNSTSRYYFEGCNLKYDRMDEYAVNVIDSSGEIIDKIPSFPTLSVSNKTVGEILERNDVKAIGEFFTENKFSNKITINDLNALKIENFDKEEIVQLYNQLLETDYEKRTNLLNLEPCSIKKETQEQNDYFQIGILVDAGRFKAVRIDYIDGEGKYLSDKVLSSQAREEEIEFYNSFEQIENAILETQKLDIKTKFPNYKSELHIRLFNFLKELKVYRQS